jgi:hypothetical protein
VKVFVVTSDISPILLIKADSEEEAKEKFVFGMGELEDKYLNHPSLKVREATQELLMQVLPNECKVDPDAGF